MAVGPSGVLPVRRPQGIEQALLREQHERPLGNAAPPRLALRRDDLRERPAQMHRGGPRALRGAPRDRPVERPVELEYPGPVPESLHPSAVAIRKSLAGERDELPGRHVEQHPFRPGELLEIGNTMACLDSAAERAEIRGHRIRDRLRPAPGKRPAHAMRQQPEKPPERGCRRPRQRQHRVRGETREQAARLLTAKRAAGDHARGQRRERREAGKRSGMPRPPEWRQQVLADLVVLLRERPHEPPVAPCVNPERGGRVGDGADEQRGAPVVERVRESRRRLDPLDAVLLERHRAQERRGDGERMDRRADVVDEARQRQLGRPAAAAERFLGLQHPHRQPGPGEMDCRGEAVRPRPDDNRIRHLPEATRPNLSRRYLKIETTSSATSATSTAAGASRT